MSSRLIRSAVLAVGYITIFSAGIEATIRVWESNDVKFENVWHSYLSRNASVTATVVRVGVYINTIYSVNELNMDFTVNLLLRMNWKDARLAAPFNQSSLKARRAIHPDMESRIWNQIWLPDITFRNEIRSFFHVVPVPNKLLIIHGDGRTYFVPKLTLSLTCRMDLRKFPMDTQRCPMYMESYGHTTETLVMEWLENDESVEFDPELELSQYRLIGHERHNCTMGYQTGYYPCLRVDIILKRNVYYYLVQIYLPATLVVILSWVGFWINCSSEPARVSLSLLTVLTMSTQRASVNTSLPPVSYVKALDIWMTTSLIFVFLSLIEYAIVNVLARGGLSKQFARTARRRKRNRRRWCLKDKGNAGKGETLATTVEDETIVTSITREQSGTWSICPLAQPETTDTPCFNGSIVRDLFKCARHRENGPTSHQKNGPTCSFSPFTPQKDKNEHSTKLLETTLTTSPSCISNIEDKVITGQLKPATQQLTEKELCLRRAQFVDLVARFLFPLSFVLFNVIYWFHYFRDLYTDNDS